MKRTSSILAGLIVMIILASCTSGPESPEQFGSAWVKAVAEYDTIAALGFRFDEADAGYLAERIDEMRGRIQFQDNERFLREFQDLSYWRIGSPMPYSDGGELRYDTLRSIEFKSIELSKPQVFGESISAYRDVKIEMIVNDTLSRELEIDKLWFLNGRYKILEIS